MALLVAAVEVIGSRSTISSWLGLVAGTWGIIYGIKAKTFTAYGPLHEQGTGELFSSLGTSAPCSDDIGPQQR
jgi:hypothetical protein